MTISREKTLWLKNKKNPLEGGKTQWGNFTVFREPIKHNKIYFSQNKVVSRHLTSSFVGHTRGEDLKKNFEEATKDLDKKMLSQVSMDGPNVNWKMHDKLVDERGENEQFARVD